MVAAVSDAAAPIFIPDLSAARARGLSLPRDRAANLFGDRLAMPTLATKSPIVILALSPNATATATGVRIEAVRQAIAEGKLIVRKIRAKRRIAVFGAGGVQEWVESWPQVEPKKRNVPHGS